MALIAVDKLGETYVVIDHCGPAVDWHAGEYGSDGLLDDDEGRPSEPGLWVWIGDIYSAQFDTLDGMEWDLVTEGSCRRPNARELAAAGTSEPVWGRDTLEKRDGPRRKRARPFEKGSKRWKKQPTP